MSGDSALVLMCKAPVSGKVKTRLCPPLTPREAAGLYACLLEDTAAEAVSLRRLRKFLFHSPPEARGHFLAAPFSGFILMDQKGYDLGERMTNAMDAAFSSGARRVAVIGADCPALSAGRIRSALRELEDGADAVFGPAEDGGFYLIGLCAPSPDLLRGIAWSTRTVLAAVISRCRNAGMAYALLPAELDIDTAESLDELRRRMRLGPRPACPRTREWLGIASRRVSPVTGRITS
ncbi:MAG: TIGR04282 family arsenosugar biosynthesis glycosyltransferase [Deltaproteobacteria bacterium]|nr:TIGR04282 family arsenosugar biosynthesis glycosyltransferase [Deltaproteobacteria bacterium]